MIQITNAFPILHKEETPFHYSVRYWEVYGIKDGQKFHVNVYHPAMKTTEAELIHLVSEHFAK